MIQHGNEGGDISGYCSSAMDEIISRVVIISARSSPLLKYYIRSPDSMIYISTIIITRSHLHGPWEMFSIRSYNESTLANYYVLRPPCRTIYGEVQTQYQVRARWS